MDELRMNALLHEVSCGSALRSRGIVRILQTNVPSGWLGRLNSYMKQLFAYSVPLKLALVFVSSGVVLAGEKRVEAEHMRLANYQVDSSETATFIKLIGSTGVATINFDLPSGRYDVDACYLSEKAGQNTYAMYLNGTQIISWLGKDRDDKWHLMTEQKWHAPRNVSINKGDEIRVEALSGTGSLAVLDYLEFSESKRSDAMIRQNLVTMFPEEYSRAIRNPLKGFRSSLGKEHEYGTLIKTYFKWNEMEKSQSDGVDIIKEVCDARWQGCEQKNIKLIPRVYLAWPRQESGWPVDMKEGDFTSDRFKQRVIALIKKLGKAWDNDSRVAFVEMGLIGQWGEMEWPDTTDEIKAAMAAQFAASFQNKLVMVRWPNTYNDRAIYMTPLAPTGSVLGDDRRLSTHALGTGAAFQ